MSNRNTVLTVPVLSGKSIAPRRVRAAALRVALAPIVILTVGCGTTEVVVQPIDSRTWLTELRDWADPLIALDRRGTAPALAIPDPTRVAVGRVATTQDYEVGLGLIERTDNTFYDYDGQLSFDLSRLDPPVIRSEQVRTALLGFEFAPAISRATSDSIDNSLSACRRSLAGVERVLEVSEDRIVETATDSAVAELGPALWDVTALVRQAIDDEVPRLELLLLGPTRVIRESSTALCGYGPIADNVRRRCQTRWLRRPEFRVGDEESWRFNCVFNIQRTELRMAIVAEGGGR